MVRNGLILTGLVALAIAASSTAETETPPDSLLAADADSLEPPPPDTLHVWTEPGVWHLRWWSIELPAIFEGNVVARGPGTIDSIHRVDIDSTDIRIEAGDRRLRFRSSADSTAHGIDVYSSAPSLSIGITINGAEPESLSSMLIGREGEKNPPGFPFSVKGSRTRAQDTAETNPGDRTIGHNMAWAALPPPPPPPGGCVLWLDERGWHLDWPEETLVSGRIAAAVDGYATPDTLELTDAYPPVRVGSQADTLWLEMDSDSTWVEIGAQRIRSAGQRLILVPGS